MLVLTRAYLVLKVILKLVLSEITEIQAAVSKAGVLLKDFQFKKVQFFLSLKAAISEYLTDDAQ